MTKIGHSIRGFTTFLVISRVTDMLMSKSEQWMSSVGVRLSHTV